MAEVTLNEYSLLTVGGSKSFAVAASMADAAALMDTDVSDLGSTLTLVKSGLKVDLPLPYVKFETKVSPVDAEATGCLATPYTYTVKSGEKVIFTAISAPGYDFVEWQLNGTVVSTDAVAELTVVQSTPSSEWEIYTAVFEPAP